MKNYTQNLKMCLLQQHQVHKEIIINENFTTLDCYLNGGVKSRKAAVLPEIADDGDKYIINSDALGQMRDHINKIAVRANNKWLYIAPSEGTVVFIIDEKRQVVFLDGKWQEIA